MKHVSIRVPWHDNKWNGAVCLQPEFNPFCRTLSRIAESKDDAKEEKVRGCQWCKLSQDQLPACKGENGAFMNSEAYQRIIRHVYSNYSEKHRDLLPKVVNFPPYSFAGVPFRYMALSSEDEMDRIYPDLPQDEDAPFKSNSWVYGRERQGAILENFIEEIKPEESLVVFYCKNGTPVDEDSRRLIVGMGEITHCDGVAYYDSKSDITYPLWELVMSHSIRPKLSESKGFLLPYHEYLELDDEFIQDKTGLTKFQALDQIKLSLDKLGNSQSIFSELSYGCEYVSNHSMLIILAAAYECIKNVIRHDLVGGDWDLQLRWIDDQISKVKAAIGPFPSFAECLRSLGFNYAYLIEHDLRKGSYLGLKDNPWLVFEDFISGKISIDSAVYNKELPYYRQLWSGVSEKEKEILTLLSRFEINRDVAKYWLDRPSEYNSLIENPYLISEACDFNDSLYVTTQMIDIGVIVDREIQGEWVPKKPTQVDTKIDERRIRSLVIFKLKSALLEGDTLLSVSELQDYVNSTLSQDNIELPRNFLMGEGNKSFFEEKLEYINKEPDSASEQWAIQLREYTKIEDFLRSKFKGRAKASVRKPVKENWEQMVKDSIEGFDESNPRSTAAIKDQIEAVKMFADKKLSVLTGGAGTGKTTVVQAFLSSQQIRNEGVLLLAPTGKARVRLGQMAEGVEAYTIAQFLTPLGFFNWKKMEAYLPTKFEDKQCKKYKNVIIDECSMLTSKDFYILLNALDLGTVQRIILIGDPNQLPPIGEGRPFADLYNYLVSPDQDPNLRNAVTELKTVVRTIKKGVSDNLLLASWFSGDKPSKDADEIFEKIESGTTDDSLAVYTWSDESELKSALQNVLMKELDASEGNLSNKIMEALGLDDVKRAVGNPQVIEKFQVLTPVVNPVWGTFDLNSLFQQWVGHTNRKYAVEMSSEFVYCGDKIIQLVNERKKCNNGEEKQLSNGLIGFVTFANEKSKASVTFSLYPNTTFSYYGVKSDERQSNIQLAYAITIHKSQGSDFDNVIVVLPKKGRILSRELIYTALTRAKKRLIILVEETPGWLRQYTKPQSSILKQRNTNLFNFAVREQKATIPFAEGLIHITNNGIYVRSKSEVIIANMLLERGIKFKYEEQLEGSNRIPDFTFTDAADEPVILEHLGMLTVPSYVEAWKKKKEFYNSIGFVEGDNLFTTCDEANGGIDCGKIGKILDQIQERLE